MGVLNRTLDNSQSRQVFESQSAATATGVTGILCTVPSQSVVEYGQLLGFGLSGSPNVSIVCNRFIVGAGVTAITIATGTSNAIAAAYGTSGPQSILFGASTLLLPNDVLMWQTGVANTAVTGLSVSIVIRPLQDVVTHFGSNTF